MGPPPAALTVVLDDALAATWDEAAQPLVLQVGYWSTCVPFDVCTVF